MKGSFPIGEEKGVEHGGCFGTAFGSAGIALVGEAGKGDILSSCRVGNSHQKEEQVNWTVGNAHPTNPPVR